MCLNEYHVLSNSYPETIEAVLSLPQVQHFVESIQPDPLIDGWGNPLAYVASGEGFLISSPGPDGILGNGDDMTTGALEDTYGQGETPSELKNRMEEIIRN